MKGQNKTGFKKNQEIHKPVLVNEVIKQLGLRKSAHLNKEKRFIDATVGAGGHSKELVKRGAEILGIDLDVSMLNFAKDVLEKACPTPIDYRGCFKLVAGNYKDIDEIAKSVGFSDVDGILFDLGVSSYHFDKSVYGMSYKYLDAPLDMRFDKKGLKVTAADLLNALGVSELVKMLSVTMNYHESRKLAKLIVSFRSDKKIERVKDFVEIIDTTYKRKKINSVTLPFMAARIAVNTELENLKTSLPKAVNLLRSGGKMIVISFHSGEDKIVKDFYKVMQSKDYAKILTKKPIIPKRAEIESNSRSRSAKMRILKKT